MIQTADFDLWVRLAAQGRFMVMAEPLVQFRSLPNGNLGGPGAAARVQREASFVLERFSQPPSLDLFPAIFPDLPDPGRQGVRMVTLCLRALERRRASGAEMADRVLSAVLDYGRLRQEAVEAHGVAFIRDFLARRIQPCGAPP